MVLGGNVEVDNARTSVRVRFESTQTGGVFASGKILTVRFGSASHGLVGLLLGSHLGSPGMGRRGGVTTSQKTHTPVSKRLQHEAKQRFWSTFPHDSVGWRGRSSQMSFSRLPFLRLKGNQMNPTCFGGCLTP